MTSIALAHHNDSLSVLQMDMEFFLTAPIFQLHFVKVIMKLTKYHLILSVYTTSSNMVVNEHQ